MGQKTVLQSAELLPYEFIISEDDFAVALNGAGKLADYRGFSIDQNASLVLHQESAESVTAPIPVALRPLVDSAEEVWFIKLSHGKVVDAKVLERMPNNAVAS